MASSNYNQRRAKSAAKRRQNAKARSQKRQETLDLSKKAKKERVAHRSFLIKVILVGVALAMVGAFAALFLSYGDTSSSTASTTTSSTSSTTTTTTTTPQEVIAQSHASALAVRAGCPANPYTRVNTLSWKKEPVLSIDIKRYYEAHFTTTAGDFTITLDPTEAPHTVNNFVFLADHKYYHCVIFQRVIPGFVIQGGDPTGTGNGGPGYSFDDELPPTAKTGSPTYPLYSVAMANSGPNTNGSQFFIVVGAEAESLPNSYSLFGRVTAGIPAVKRIASGGTATGTPVVIQRILNVSITPGAVITK